MKLNTLAAAALAATLAAVPALAQDTRSTISETGQAERVRVSQFDRQE